MLSIFVGLCPIPYISQSISAVLYNSGSYEMYSLVGYILTMYNIKSWGGGGGMEDYT